MIEFIFSNGEGLSTTKDTFQIIFWALSEEVIIRATEACADTIHLSTSDLMIYSLQTFQSFIFLFRDTCRLFIIRQELLL